MKLFSRLMLISLISSVCYAKQNWSPHIEEIIPDVKIEITQDQESDPKPQIIIQSVANILANVSAIAAAPRDKQNLGQGITGILANVINIALISGKHNHRSKLDLFNMICDELHLDEKTRELIKQKIEELNTASC